MNGLAIYLQQEFMGTLRVIGFQIDGQPFQKRSHKRLIVKKNG